MILIEHVLDAARGRLAVLSREAHLFDAAAVLVNPDTPLVLICNGEGVAIGVISRTDVLRALAEARADACSASAESVMTRSIFSCRAHEPLQQVWQVMSKRSLRCAPILDEGGRPQGILHARDVAVGLLDEVTSEELLLRDYVLGIGYQ